jgi:hypothetical protein
MARTLPQHYWRLGVLGALLALIPPAVSSEATPASSPTGTAEIGNETVRLARRIVRDLQAGHPDEARVDADLAVKRYPVDPLLRLRRAQALYSVALELDAQFGRVAEDLNLSMALDLGLQVTRNPPAARSEDPVDREASERGRQAYIQAGQKLFTPEVLAAIQRFKEQARQQLKDSGALLERRSQMLRDALSDLGESRRLGDESVEGALTGFWLQVAPLLWRQEQEELTRPTVAGATAAAVSAQNGASGLTAEEPSSLPLDVFDKSLAPFHEITPDSVLRAAAQTAKEHPSDPKALAGAADVISIVAALKKCSDPLRENARSLLDHRYLKHYDRFSSDATPEVRAMRRQVYLRLRDVKDPDVVLYPAAVALQLYERALEQDSEGALPWLRLRLYLLRVVFDPEGARPLVEQIARKEPENAVVPLERARLAFMLEDKPEEGMRFIREAARLRTFSRSYLVAVPDPLRPALKFDRGLRELVTEGWPGYRWLFGTLSEMEISRLELRRLAEMGKRPALPAGELAEETEIPLLQIKLAGENELAGLQLQLADLFCGAPDYSDQLLGINGKASAFDFLGTWGKLPRDQQALLRRLQLEHQRTYADYPSGREFVSITPNGLEWIGPLSLLPSAFKPVAPRLTMGRRGVLLN